MQMKSMILSLFLVLIHIAPIQAQTAAPVSPNASTTTDGTVLGGQVPDEATKKITELVHAGQYAEAQKLTAGLLIAYPNDQRLIKAKAVIEKLLAPGDSSSPSPGSSQPAEPVANTNAGRLTGMDKVEYSALIVLARQAQQTTDLAEQKNCSSSSWTRATRSCRSIPLRCCSGSFAQRRQ